MVRLVTERLVIRDPRPDDLHDWHRLMSDARNMYYLQDIMTHSPEESRQNLDDAVADAERPGRTKYFLAIEHRETGVFIGTAGYTVQETTRQGKLAHVGYFILPEHHGHGYMTEALREVIRFAFEEDDVFRLHTGCLSENRASERVMQKCGFTKEAEFFAYIWHDGRMKDRVEYRLLRKEWQAAQVTDGASYTYDPMHIKDYDEIYQLWRSVPGVGLSEADHREPIGAYLSCHPGQSFVCRINGSIVGTILCGNDGRRTYIHHTAVMPEHRRHGIAAELVRLAMDAQRERGMSKCHLFIFNENEQGKAFWRTMGFELRRDISVMSKGI